MTDFKFPLLDPLVIYVINSLYQDKEDFDELFSLNTVQKVGYLRKKGSKYAKRGESFYDGNGQLTKRNIYYGNKRQVEIIYNDHEITRLDTSGNIKYQFNDDGYLIKAIHDYPNDGGEIEFKFILDSNNKLVGLNQLEIINEDECFKIYDHEYNQFEIKSLEYVLDGNIRFVDYNNVVTNLGLDEKGRVVSRLVGDYFSQKTVFKEDGSFTSYLNNNGNEHKFHSLQIHSSVDGDVRLSTFYNSIGLEERFYLEFVERMF